MSALLEGPKVVLGGCCLALLAPGGGGGARSRWGKRVVGKLLLAAGTNGNLILAFRLSVTGETSTSRRRGLERWLGTGLRIRHVRVRGREVWPARPAHAHEPRQRATEAGQGGNVSSP